MKKNERLTAPINQKLADAMMAVLKVIHDPNHTGQIEPELLERQRKNQDILGKMVTPPLDFSWEPFDLNGLPMAWVRPERGHDPSRVILYCHGGGYTTGNLGYARVLAAKMASVTGCEVLTFAYRLAPEYPWPASQQDAMAAWDYLMHLGYGADNVVLAGDSAGGNMALVLAQALRSAGRRMPRRLVLFSPWTDMTSSGESYQRCRDVDPMVSLPYIQAVRSAYAPGQDWSRPEFSPLFGDFSGFPPHPDPGGRSGSALLRLRRPAPAPAGGKCAVGAGVLAGYVARLSDVPPPAVRRGHGQGGCVPADLRKRKHPANADASAGCFFSCSHVEPAAKLSPGGPPAQQHQARQKQDGKGGAQQ